MSFHYAEADDVAAGGVPAELTEDLTQFYRAMRGTNEREPRCAALRGEIGCAASCAIYPRRPGVCREFLPSYADGATANESCDRARARHGLPPLRPDDWLGDDDRTLCPAA